MYNEMTFGKCLKFLLTTFHLPMSQLAKAINVDNSLVSHWVHERRFPSTQYINSITDFLSKNIMDSLQLKMVDELFYSLKVNEKITEITNKEKLHIMLQASLKYSLACRTEKKGTSSESRSDTTFLNSIDLSSNDKLIYGITNVFTAGISLIESARTYCRKENNVIYLTYHNILDNSFFSDNRLSYLREILLEVIQNNWQVTFLLTLDSNVERAVRLISFIFPLLKTGKINLYNLTNNESFMTGKELYVVSGIGALSCFPTDAYTGINCAFYLKNKSAVDVLTNYVNLLIKNNSNNIVKYYNQEMKDTFFFNLTDSNEQLGNHYCYNNSFSKLLIPTRLYQKFLDQTDLSKEEKKLSIYYYEKQFRGFLKNLVHHICTDIYFTSAFEKLCEDKIIFLYTYTGIKIVPASTQDVVDYLEYAISIIKQYENYQIAVIYQDMDGLEKNIALSIKERKEIFLYVYGKNRTVLDTFLSLDDPVIVKAFVEYYKYLWQKISPLNKDKEDIVLLIESYVRMLNKEIT